MIERGQQRSVGSGADETVRIGVPRRFGPTRIDDGNPAGMRPQIGSRPPKIGDCSDAVFLRQQIAAVDDMRSPVDVGNGKLPTMADFTHLINLCGI